MNFNNMIRNRICRGKNWRVLAVNLQTNEHYVIKLVRSKAKGGQSPLPFNLIHFTNKLIKENKLKTSRLGLSRGYRVADNITRFHQDWVVFYADSHIWDQVIPDIDIMNLFSNYDFLNEAGKSKIKEQLKEEYEDCFRLNLDDLLCRITSDDIVIDLI